MHALFGFVLSLMPSASAATYAEVLSPVGLVERADAVVRGEVVATEPVRQQDGWILTKVTIAVDEVYAGSADDTLTFQIPGGSLDGTNLSVDGAPQFSRGDEVVVFVRDGRLVGFGQGAFAVDEAVAERTLGNAVPGSNVVLDLDRDFGQPEAAQSCMEMKVNRGLDDGWSIRAASGQRIGVGEMAAWQMTLLAENEYQFDICGDGLSSLSGLYITDEAGKVVARSLSTGRDVTLAFSPESTGHFYVAATSDGLADGVMRSAVSIGVTYR